MKNWDTPNSCNVDSINMIPNPLTLQEKLYTNYSCESWCKNSQQNIELN
jgi:hypothetical protein